MPPLGDIPTISDASHAHTVYGMQTGSLSALNSVAGTTSGMGMWAGSLVDIGTSAAPDLMAKAVRYRGIPDHRYIDTTTTEEPMANPAARRLVQVFIADPNENIPLNDCLLYRGDNHLTDLNDQELFYELDIKALLTAHNEKRVKIVDKKVKERVEYLEPAKIRDLKMVVVTIASF